MINHLCAKDTNNRMYIRVTLALSLIFLYGTQSKDYCEKNDMLALMVRLRKQSTEFHNEMKSKDNELQQLKQDIKQLNLVHEQLQNVTNQLKTDIACLVPDLWTRFNSSCYLFNDNIKRDWMDASHHCARYQSTLVTIESKEEDAFLRDFLNRLFRDNKEQINFWIGGSDTVNENVWTWYTDNSTIGYTNWHPGQPDDIISLSEDCLELRGQYGFLWNDFTCSSKSFSICEKRMV